MDSAQKPLELILARNLATSLATPSLIVDEDGELVFYNEAAGALLGMSYEDSGRMDPAEWGRTFGPFDEHGEPIPFEELPSTRALREARPTHANYRIRSTAGDAHEIEVSALPLRGDGQYGAMVVFWPSEHG